MLFKRLDQFTVSASLKWEEHINTLKKELKQRMFLLKQIKQALSINELKTIAEALFNSKLRYGIAVFGQVRLRESDPCPGQMKDLQLSQNSMMRLICGKRITDKVSIQKLLEKTNFLSVNQMAAQHIMCMTWDIVRENAIPEMKEKLILKKNIYSTRAFDEENLNVVCCAKEKHQSFLNRCSKIWNEAPISIKNVIKQEHVMLVAWQNIVSN